MSNLKPPPLPQNSSIDEDDKLDSARVTTWLDKHPEFLSDYLKKLQIRAKRTSIINDKNATSLLASLHPGTNKNNSISSKQNDPASTSTHNDNIAFKSTLINFSNNIKSNINSYTSMLQMPSMILFTSNTSNILSNTTTTTTTTTTSKLKSTASIDSTSNQVFVNRNKFKKLSLYEKMFTLVKTIYQSLDLKITCKKILNTVSLLLDADRCSLFLVVDDDSLCQNNASNLNDNNDNCKKCLISVVFDAKSNEKLNPDEDEETNNKSNEELNEQDVLANGSNEIKIPYGQGIVGYVASTGKILNIPDAYKDSRFNSNIDKKTGYKTKSILCLPILNESGQCIAVAEAINKLNDDYASDHVSNDTNLNENSSDACFTKDDEEIFSKFMPFIAIAIRNSNLYSDSRKEGQKNKVLLELATIVFDESSSTVDNLVSRILFNSIFLLECESCQVILLNTNQNIYNIQQAAAAEAAASISSNSLSVKTNKLRRLSVNTVNSYFDRIYELNYDDLMKNESYSTNGILLKPKMPNFTLNSPELDIINTVIQSGNVLNIKNLLNEPKYANMVKNTNMKSLLCIPVINSNDQVVALIFASNKIKNSSISYFTQSDINIAQAFALFCGIGIQNIMMYEKVVRAMNMQQVALDVLSYHVSANQQDVESLIDEQIPDPIDIGLLSFGFDENTLDDIGTLKACISMFSDLGLIEKFNIPYEVLCRFFLTVKKNYRPVAYHNWRHGFNVMACMFTILSVGKYQKVYNDLEILSLLIACICHDLDHRGTTNTFQIKIQSPLAKLYTTSTMEHHHFNQCIIILHNNMNNILMNLTQAQHSTAIDLIEKAILATDLAVHFKHVDKFLDKTNSKNFSFETQSDKDILLNMLMTACDLSGGTKPWKCHYRLSNLVSAEFFSEGDLEKEKFKNEPIDSMNRNKSDQLPQMQIQFLQGVCMPLYNALSICNPLLKPLVDGCEENLKEWKKMIKK